MVSRSSTVVLVTFSIAKAAAGFVIHFQVDLDTLGRERGSIIRVKIVWNRYSPTSLRFPTPGMWIL